MAEKTVRGALAERLAGAEENSGTKLPLGDGEICGGDGGQMPTFQMRPRFY